MHSIRIKILSRIITRLVLCLFLVVTLVNPVSSNAQTANNVNGLNPTNNLPSTYTLLEPLPCLNGDTTCTSGQQVTDIQFKDYVTYVFNLIIALAAVAAVFMIVLGGFQYMSSDSYSGKSDGLKKLQNALLGLLLVLSSYLILRTIDPRLVEIPSTLVAPLNIEYKPDELSSFFQQLVSDANKFRAENSQLISDVSAGLQQIKDLDAKQKALCDQLLSLATLNTGITPDNSGPYKDQCHALLAQSSNLSPAAQALATQIADIDNQRQQIQTSVATKQARGIMNAQIQRCYGVTTQSSSDLFGNYGNGLTVNDCLNEIAKTEIKYEKTLRDSGATVEAQQVKDYAIYANSITKINTTILVNMSNSPGAKALVDTTQGIVTLAGTAGGAVLGGVAGAGAGFVGSQAFNGIVINGLVTANNMEAAKETISEIQLEINKTANTIQDPAVRNQFTAQAYSLIKNLGGKGDGTDSTANAGERSRAIEQGLNNTINIGGGMF